MISTSLFIFEEKLMAICSKILRELKFKCSYQTEYFNFSLQVLFKGLTNTMLKFIKRESA